MLMVPSLAPLPLPDWMDHVWPTEKTMKTLNARLISIAASLMVAVPAWAGEAAHAGVDAQGVMPDKKQAMFAAITAIVLFLVVFGILAVFAWPKIVKGLDDRENKIRSEIEAAEAARQQASMALEQYQKSLAEARAEAQKMIDAAKAQMNSQINEMKAKAEVDAANLKAKALADIEAAKKQALADIYSQSSSLATQVAGKILRREVSGQDTQRFVDEALAGVR
jgi:F-type H+-transporting ATPase subunit b